MMTQGKAPVTPTQFRQKQESTESNVTQMKLANLVTLIANARDRLVGTPYGTAAIDAIENAKKRYQTFVLLTTC